MVENNSLNNNDNNNENVEDEGDYNSSRDSS